VFENGTVLEGESFGHLGAAAGEIVFTTSMCGYQENITDPAYKGQILVSAFPMIGNYGVSKNYDSTDGVHISALVVRECCREPSDMYGGDTLDGLLRKHKVPGIEGIDTRDIVAMIRDNGSMNSAVVVDEKDVKGTIKKLKGKRENVNAGLPSSKDIKKLDNGKKTTIGLIDCGAGNDLIKDLSRVYNVVIFPYGTGAKEILSANVKSVVISNGPGDPNDADVLIKTVKEISSSVPVACIGFGASAVAKAFGCKIMKLKYGHHGSNLSVRRGSRVYITTQNHMYYVDEASMKGTGLVADQFNVNDGTPEGFSHDSLPIFGIQYYPISPEYEKDSFFYIQLEKITEGGR
jgi:carbamoyl-phosphate synthase small subunit